MTNNNTDCARFALALKLAQIKGRFIKRFVCTGSFRFTTW